MHVQVKAVVIGYDRHFSFSKAIKACSYAKNSSNLFIGTNMDTSLPMPNKDIVVPGKTLNCPCVYALNCPCVHALNCPCICVYAVSLIEPQ